MKLNNRKLAHIFFAVLICCVSFQSTLAQQVYSRAGLREAKQTWINIENLDEDQRALGITQGMYKNAILQGLGDGSCGLKIGEQRVPLFLCLNPAVMVNWAKDGTVKGPVTGMIEISLRRGGFVIAPNHEMQLVFGMTEYFHSSKQFIFDLRDFNNGMILGAARSLAAELCSAINNSKQYPGEPLDQAVLDASCVAKANSPKTPAKQAKATRSKN